MLLNDHISKMWRANKAQSPIKNSFFRLKRTLQMHIKLVIPFHVLFEDHLEKDFSWRKKYLHHFLRRTLKSNFSSLELKKINFVIAET